MGVDVYFEEQHIHTQSTDGELMMTILASYAQEESLSASENQKWRVRKAFENGELINLRFMYGYNISPDGIEINEKKAAVVREIFTRFNNGDSMSSICRDLESRGIKGALGGTWCPERMRCTLSNEKYLGNALLQKRYRNNHIDKRLMPNRGELPMYYAEGTHEPIIDQATFNKAQAEFERRKRISRQYSGKSIFSSRIICGDCGSYFGSKVWNLTSKYRRVIWQCNGKFKGEHKCETPHLDDETIKARFVTAFNAVLDGKDNILEDCRLMQATLTDCAGIDAEIESLLEEIDVVTELTKRCIAENSQTAQNQEEYTARYNGFVERYEKAKAQLEQLRATKVAREAQAEAIGAFMFEIQELDALAALCCGTSCHSHRDVSHLQDRLSQGVSDLRAGGIQAPYGTGGQAAAAAAVLFRDARSQRCHRHHYG